MIGLLMMIIGIYMMRGMYDRSKDKEDVAYRGTSTNPQYYKKSRTVI